MATPLPKTNSDTTYPMLADLVGMLDDNDLLLLPVHLDDASASTVVSGVDCDSRHVKPGHVFVCKGKAFVPDYLVQAHDKGAIAYLCEEGQLTALADACPGMPAIVTGDLRKAMALLCVDAWGHPDRDIDVIGITGTKGKTTAAYMLRAILDAGDESPATGVMGSVDTYDGIESFESVNTTPEAPDMWRHLANVRDSGLGRMVMEVSSQALRHERVVDLHLDVACFLNIGRDHISALEHPDFEDYFASKLRIFGHADVAVVNIDTEFPERVLEAASVCNKVITTSSTEGRTANVTASGIESHDGTVSFSVTSGRGTRKMGISMPGLFNVDNALVAIAVAELLGVGDDQIRKGLGNVYVPGRMKLVRTFDPKVTALVDYAHNVLSYQRFFSSVVREFPGRKVIALFGAPGDKAQERRHDLPVEASKWSDLNIYAEEDPAHEDPADICAELAANTPEGQDYRVIVDRPEAIAYATKVAFDAPEGAIVCLLAKGDETRQHEGDLFVPCETDGDIFLREVEKVRLEREG